MQSASGLFSRAAVLLLSLLVFGAPCDAVALHARRQAKAKTTSGTVFMQGQVSATLTNRSHGEDNHSSAEGATIIQSTTATQRFVAIVDIAKPGTVASWWHMLRGLRFEAASVLLSGFAVCLAVAAAAMLLCCVYDAVARWRHQARFRSCHAKVWAVHEALHSSKGDFLLCPCCIEPITSCRSPKNVVFLCGHRFHVKCSNNFFQEHPQSPTECPICACGVAPGDVKIGQGGQDGNWDSGDMPDGALAFMLWSLHKRYPDIVTAECVQRWIACHTEIWLSELTCPKFSSILRKQAK